MHELYNYFKSLNEDKHIENSDFQTNTSDFLSNANHTNLNTSINKPFPDIEIIAAVKILKNNKSSGIDNILIEHLKTSIHIMTPVYTKLFNIIFDTGLVPESWR